MKRQISGIIIATVILSAIILPLVRESVADYIPPGPYAVTQIAENVPSITDKGM